jgi:hypothetical protein
MVSIFPHRQHADLTQFIPTMPTRISYKKQIKSEKLKDIWLYFIKKNLIAGLPV